MKNIIGLNENLKSSRFETKMTQDNIIFAKLFSYGNKSITINSQHHHSKT